MKPPAQGLHLLVDARATQGLDDWIVVRHFVEQAIALTGLQLVHFWQEEFSLKGQFGPGITAVAVISESSLTLHTRTEAGLLNLDLFSCREFDADLVVQLLTQTFGITEVLQRQEIKRF